jgi:putative oxidoreductase
MKIFNVVKSSPVKYDLNIGSLVLRVFMGCAFIWHGHGKLFGGMGEFAGHVRAMHLPLATPLAYAAAVTEVFGGLFLAVGLFTRISAALIATEMVVTAFVVHRSGGFAGKELDLLYLVCAVMFVIEGGKTYSVDRLIS